MNQNDIILDILDDSENKAESNHDLLSYFIEKKQKVFIENARFLQEYIKNNDVPDKLITSIETLISEYNLLKKILADELNKTLSQHYALAADLFQLEEEKKQLEKQLTYDSLTGVHSKSSIIENIMQQIRLFIRSRNDVFTLILVDIDYFKSINDTYGHLTGDIILKFLGKILKTSVREADIPGRFGGEEFVIILPRTGIKSAILVAERLRIIVELIGKNNDEKNRLLGSLEKKHNVEEMNLIKRKVLELEEIMPGEETFKKAIKNATVSIGITQIIKRDTELQKDPDKIFTVLFERADKAMYHSKNSGRNHVSIRLPEMLMRKLKNSILES